MKKKAKRLALWLILIVCLAYLTGILLLWLLELKTKGII
jgi:hypothetical protein